VFDQTELEGSAQNLSNGGPPEERTVPDSAPAQVGGSNDTANGDGVSQLTQPAVADGMADVSDSAWLLPVMYSSCIAQNLRGLRLEVVSSYEIVTSRGIWLHCEFSMHAAV
jgi:hypothetical protein